MTTKPKLTCVCGAKFVISEGIYTKYYGACGNWECECVIRKETKREILAALVAMKRAAKTKTKKGKR